MTKGKRQEPVPQEREKTVRQEIIEILKEGYASMRDLSGLIGMSEKEVFQQLSQIQKGAKLEIEPAECLSCGFLFNERDRLKKPGKCPKCRKTQIAEPRFTMR